MVDSLESNLTVTMGEGCGEGIVNGVWDGRVHTAVFKMDHQQGPAALNRELCSMSRGSLAGRGLGGERILYMCG